MTQPLIIALIAVLASVFLLAIILICSRLRRKYLISAADALLIDAFGCGNVYVFGGRGTGKDLIFAHVIALRGQPHYSNMPYNAQTEVRPLLDISVAPNTFDTMTSNQIIKIPRTFVPGRDFFITDAGIYLASQYNKELNTKYPSMPIRFALSRQLDQMNIHSNAQSFGRLWDKLREQADSFVRCRKCIEYDDCFLVRFIYYSEYRSAENGILPSRVPGFESKHGRVEWHTACIKKTELHYDTHYFASVFFENPKTESVAALKRHWRYLK